jgi:hypothetical protein
MLIYEIAFQLGYKSINHLLELPYEELLGWLAYFDKRPIGWREDDRTHKLLSVQGVKEKPADIFPSLRPIYHPTPANADGMIDMNNLKRSAFFQRIISAKGGDKLDIF